MNDEMNPQNQKPFYSTIEHDRYVRTIIRTIGAQVQAEAGKPIDENVMVVGDEWFYIGKVQNVGSPQNQGGLISFGQPFMINCVGKYGLAMPVPISEIIDKFYAEIDEFALIPEGEKRIEEARELGEIVEEQNRFFKLRNGNHVITVYDLNKFGAEHSYNEEKSSGWTTFKK